MGFIGRPTAADHPEMVAGGSAAGGTGYQFKPTAVADALQVDEVLQRAVLAPGVSATRSSNTDQAIDRANDNDDRLDSSVWTVDVGRATATAASPRYGSTFVNCDFMLANEMRMAD